MAVITLDIKTMPPSVSRQIRVFLNGKDVTFRAFWAKVPDEPGEEGRGVVRLYRLTRSGRKFAILNRKGERVASQTVKVGIVRWERKVDG